MTVQTVLGAVDDLGWVDAHEHLFLRSPALAGEDFDDLDRMSQEAETVKRSGIDTIVDLTPIGLGRDPVKLARLSERTGVNVVAASGFHRDVHYPAGHWAGKEPVPVLVEVIRADLEEGMDARDWQGPRPAPTPHRAGIIKLGASYQHLSPAEERRLAAGAEAARLTGVAIAAHCEIGTAGGEILDRLAERGVPPERVILAHLDRNPDPGLHAELASRGAFLVYDTVGRIKYRPDSDVIELIAGMVDAGHQGQLLLGTDVGRRSTLRAYGGGPGMDVLGREFLPRLRKRIGTGPVEAIMRHNPARALGC